MEDFELGYRETRTPFIRAAVDIPLNILNENFELVYNDLYEFTNNITDGELFIIIRNDENGMCSFEINKNIKDDIEKYDADITKTDNSIQVTIFEFKETSEILSIRNKINYVVNLGE